MIRAHLEAFVRNKRYINVEDYLLKQYIHRDKSMEEVADDLEVSLHTVRKLLMEFGISKPKGEIPLTLADAKALNPDAISVKYKVSRATAWRWKRAILRLAPDLEVPEADAAPAVGGE